MTTRLAPWASLLAALALSGTGWADQAAEEAAAELLELRMKNERPDDYALLKAAKGKEIVVVRGEMDHIERVLKTAGIPHRVISRWQVAKTDLYSDQILMVNCPGEIPRKGIRKIKKFVTAGGLLYTTDWALVNVIQRAFPGTIRFNGRETGDHVTPVQLHAHHDDLMSQMLLRSDRQPQWWLEGSSYPIKILDHDRVEVLASSRQMKKRYGAAPVVVRFRWEDGEVIHVVSHFYRQARTRGPRVAAKKGIQSVSGLSPDQKAQFGAGRGGAVDMSEVESSYAFQQMTSNLVVVKQRRNADLDKVYDFETTEPLQLEDRSAPARSRVKVLKRRGKRAQVRDDRGNVGWIEDEALQAR